MSVLFLTDSIIKSLRGVTREFFDASCSVGNLTGI